jgi:hypothetical protein
MLTHPVTKTLTTIHPTTLHPWFSNPNPVPYHWDSYAKLCLILYSPQISQPNFYTHLSCLRFPRTECVYTRDGLVGRDSSLGITTGYELDGTGIEYRWGREFPHPPDLTYSPPSLLYNGYWVSFPGVRWPRRGTDHPPHLAPRLSKE